MATVQLLQTFILVSIGLGSAIFILVAVLPSILPQARVIVTKAWENMIREVKEKADDIKAGEEKPTLESLAAGAKALESKAGNLGLRIRDIRFSLKWGQGSAVGFLTAGLFGLYALSLPLVNVSGIIHSSAEPLLDWFLALFFSAGLFMMLAFGISFFRMLDFYLKGELPSK